MGPCAIILNKEHDYRKSLARVFATAMSYYKPLNPDNSWFMFVIKDEEKNIGD